MTATAATEAGTQKITPPKKSKKMAKKMHAVRLNGKKLYNSSHYESAMAYALGFTRGKDFEFKNPHATTITDLWHSPSLGTLYINTHGQPIEPRP